MGEPLICGAVALHATRRCPVWVAHEYRPAWMMEFSARATSVAASNTFDTDSSAILCILSVDLLFGVVEVRSGRLEECIGVSKDAIMRRPASRVEQRRHRRANEVLATGSRTCHHNVCAGSARTFRCEPDLALAQECARSSVSSSSARSISPIERWIVAVVFMACSVSGWSLPSVRR